MTPPDALVFSPGAILQEVQQILERISIIKTLY